MLIQLGMPLGMKGNFGMQQKGHKEFQAIKIKCNLITGDDIQKVSHQEKISRRSEDLYKSL